MPKKMKEKTLPQMETHIEEIEQEKEQIKEFVDKHMPFEKKKKSPMPWIILVICVLLMALGELERNRILTIIAGMGFIFLVIAWIYKAIKN